LKAPGSAGGCLTQESPLVNKGNNDAPSLPIYDMESVDRIKYGIVDIGAYEWADTTPPLITTFTLPGNSITASVPVDFTASDDFGSIEYCLAKTNDPSACSWSIDKPISYTFDSQGNNVLFAFARDSDGNTSKYSSAAVMVDYTAPVMSTFKLPATSLSFTVPISTIFATDNVAVSGYFLSETNSKPLTTSDGWSSTPPTSYSFASDKASGSYPLYAWAKDSCGNVSASLSGIATIVPHPRTLIVSLNGTGKGDINSNAPSVVCTTGSCSSVLEAGTALDLFATPNRVSTFVEWGGACSGSTTCRVTMSTDKVVSAKFQLAPKAMIDKTGYTSLALAYAEASSFGIGATIFSLNDELTEDLIVGLNKQITIIGGVNPNFKSRSGLSTQIKGVFKIRQGKLVVDGISVK